MSAKTEGLDVMMTRFLQNYFAAHDPAVPPPPGLYGRILREVEKPLLEITLKTTDGNQKKAAELLGIHRDTLRKKLSDYGLLDKD